MGEMRNASRNLNGSDRLEDMSGSWDGDMKMDLERNRV
jgi:hypothetical protein